MRRKTARLRAFIDELKNKPCADCGKTFPSEAMDFDHVGQGKRREISKMLHTSEEEILREASICEVVCANCHRTRTRSRNTDVHVEMAENHDLAADLLNER